MNKIQMNNLKDEMGRLGKESAKFLKDYLQAMNKRDTGRLIASINYQTMEEANGFILRILAVDYFKYVDRQPPSKPGFRSSASGIKSRESRLTNGKPIDAKGKLKDEIINNQKEFIALAAKMDIQEFVNEMFSQH